MLGSLTVYRRLLNENVFNKHTGISDLSESDRPKLPALGHAIAGLGAGTTGIHLLTPGSAPWRCDQLISFPVSFVAAPVEHVKARLQIQYAVEKSERLYTGPIDCTKKLVRGLLPRHSLPNQPPPTTKSNVSTSRPKN